MIKMLYSSSSIVAVSSTAFAEKRRFQEQHAAVVKKPQWPRPLTETDRRCYSSTGKKEASPFGYVVRT